MKYVVAKIVEAASLAEAIRKAKKVPLTEVYIHNPSWEKNNYALTDKEEENHRIGFREKEKRSTAKS